MLRVFISYSRRDISIVNPYTMLIQQMGHEIWFDQHSIPGGALWKEEIRKAASNADVMLFFCTKAAVESEWVNYELGIALEYGVQVVPLLFEVVDLPPRISSFNWIDFTAQSFHKEAFNRLSEALAETQKRVKRDSTLPRVLLSYQFDNPLESELAQTIENALTTQGYPIVIDDRDFGIGSRSAKRILEEIDRSHYLILFVSEASAQSEVVLQVVRQASASSKVTRILPIRIAYRQLFPAQLRQYLDELSWGLWQDSRDTTRLIDEIFDALKGRPLSIVSLAEKMSLIRSSDAPMQTDYAEIPPQPYVDPSVMMRRWKLPTGAVKAESEFYVMRSGDMVMDEELGENGSTIIVKASRQMGKSSMLLRALHTAERIGKRRVFLDFQLLDSILLQDERRFYKHFCGWIVRELRLKGLTPIEEFWDPLYGNVLLCSQYVQQEIIPALDGQPLTIGLDEVDVFLRSPFRSDFFGMLRNWHNNRSYDEAWELVDLVMVISTEPYSLIENPDQSPFNVGRVIKLENFSAAQVEELNRRYQQPCTATQLERLYIMTGGHPYLTRLTLYLLATKQQTFDDLIQHAVDAQSPFKDHLSHYAMLLSGRPDLQQAMLALIKYGESPSVESAERLQRLGLVQRTADGHLVPRSQLYADYLLSTFGNRNI